MAGRMGNGTGRQGLVEDAPHGGVALDSICISRELHRVRYQHPGERQKWRLAWVDPAAVRDARSWLEARLGPLSGYEVVTVLILMRADDHAVAPLDFATPAITVHPGPLQEKLLWFAPAVEEVFLTPEEVAALWTLPPIIEGSTCCPGLP